MPWNPWAELRERDHILFALRRLPAGVLGVYDCKGEPVVILVDRGLGRRERRAVLAHELIHDERGGGARAPWMPETWTDIVTREELQIDREVARRLVPTDELRGLVHRRQELGEPTTVPDVVDEFDVPSWVAEDALELFMADVREGWR